MEKGTLSSVSNSLESQILGLSAEIIVVDNGSTDGTPEAIRQLFPQVVLIESRTNLGFARANNIGLRVSHGKYVCLINSDVVLRGRCLSQMIEFMDAHPEIGVLGPKMLSTDGSVGASVMRLPTVWNTFCCALGLHSFFSRSRIFGGFEMRGYPYDAIDNVEVLTGWFWMIPRTALEMVGELDERFFMYGEDIDWCYRFRKAGWQVVFYSEAEALHYGAASSGKSPARFYVEMRRANLQYFHKHHSRFGVLGYLFAIWVHEITRVVAYSCLYCWRPRRHPDAALKVGRSIAGMRWLLGNHKHLVAF